MVYQRWLSPWCHPRCRPLLGEGWKQWTLDPQEDRGGQTDLHLTSLVAQCVLETPAVCQHTNNNPHPGPLSVWLERQNVRPCDCLFPLQPLPPPDYYPPPHLPPSSLLIIYSPGSFSDRSTLERMTEILKSRSSKSSPMPPLLAKSY